MKIIFWGSSDFAVPSLERLLESKHEISGVVTQPDRKKGRHLQLETTPVKQCALKHKLKILQPEGINNSEFIKLLKDLKVDIFVVIAYGKILTKDILGIPKIFSVNIHGSLLPKYRGAAPINWAIINGEKKTGVSIIKMNEFMDKGDVILQRVVNIDVKDTAVTLLVKLAVVGSEVLIESLKMIEDKKAAFIPQNENNASYAPKLKKEDGLIDWARDAQSIYNHIRGMLPWPGSFTHYNNRLLKILEAEVLKSDTKGVKSGIIVDISKEAICVATGKGILKIKTLQLESSKRMNVAQFLAGHKILKESILR